jgi:putative transposase
MENTVKFFRRSLPHWLVTDRSYFVTIRLHGTLPKTMVQAFQQERAALVGAAADSATVLDLQRRQFLRLEKILDLCSAGNSWLANPDVASLVLKNMDWLREDRGWRIYAGVVMSTHLHLLMRSADGRSGELLKDMADFKRFSGRKANQILDRSGPFWAREQFDHWIRNHEMFEGTVRYILNNPVKAGLVADWRQWPWYVLDESIRSLV